MNDVPWQQLGSVPAKDLSEARLQLHHAAQIVAAVGASFLEARPDDSHPNLGWNAANAALVGHATPHTRPLRAGLRLAELQLLLLDSEHAPLAELGLDGHSWEQARSWLASALAEYGGSSDGPAPHLEAPGYELPDHPVAAGAAFRRTPAAAFAELARGYANAAGLFEAVARANPEASELRCWPHHFDLAMLLNLDAKASEVETSDAESARSIGVGFSPGDASYDEPYLYVTPWPYPSAERSLPGLRSGAHWHREGFVAAVLPFSRLATDGDIEKQRSRSRHFLDAAIADCRRLLA